MNYVPQTSLGVVPPDGKTPVFISKGFALALVVGWEWRVGRRWGAQVFGAHHVAALADLQTAPG